MPSSLFIACAALLIAAIMVPVPRVLRAVLFAILIALSLWVGLGSGMTRLWVPATSEEVPGHAGAV